MILTHAGETLCGLVACIRHPCAATEILLICLVSTHRIFTIKKALRVSTFTTGHAYCFVALSWILPTTILFIHVMYGVEVKFVPILSTCVSQIINDPRTKFITMILMLLLAVIPFAVTILSNFYMLYYAIKLSRRQSNTSFKRALSTVFAICGTFVITSLPNMVRILLPTIGKTSPQSLEIANGHIYLINASCNSIILTVINRRFRGFIVRRFLGCSCCTLWCDSTNDDMTFTLPQTTATLTINRRVTMSTSQIRNNTASPRPVIRNSPFLLDATSTLTNMVSVFTSARSPVSNMTTSAGSGQSPLTRSTSVRSRAGSRSKKRLTVRRRSLSMSSFEPTQKESPNEYRLGIRSVHSSVQFLSPNQTGITRTRLSSYEDWSQPATPVLRKSNKMSIINI